MLSIIKIMLAHEVFNTILISLDHKTPTYQIRSKFGQRMHSGQHFPVVDRIASLNSLELLLSNAMGCLSYINTAPISSPEASH